MPWLAYPHKDPRFSKLAKDLVVKGVPKLTVVAAKSGLILSENGVEDVKEKGPDVFEAWIALGEKELPIVETE